MSSKARQAGGTADFIPGLLLAAAITIAGALSLAGHTLWSWGATVAGFMAAGLAEKLITDNDETERG